MTAAPHMAEALPDDIASLVLRIGRAEWGATAEQTAEEHASDLLNTVSLTHEHFGTEDPQPMNGLYIEGTGVVICHTGMSPNSAGIARALTGAWNLLHSTALAALDSVASLSAPDDKDAEIARLREALDRLQRFEAADWYWRTMDPDDCGDSPEEAINRAMVGQFCVCEIASSFTGPTRYGFIAPVVDPESDDEEFVHFATQQEAIDAAKARRTTLT